MTYRFKPFSLNLRGTLRHFTSPQVMGIVNVTPDSFFAGSRTSAQAEISARVDRLLAEGATFIDLGAYSSRPGADDVSPDEEMRRLEIGMKAIREVSADVPVSVDTFRADVARYAVEALGADIVNDISGGDLDERMFSTVATLNVPYILMHMRGTPQTMQALADYEDVTAEVISDLSRKLRQLRLEGVSDVIVDPGFGFGKTVEQNFQLLANLDIVAWMLDAPVLAGISRKSMIYKSLDSTAEYALNGTTVLNTLALAGGAAFLRVHDAKEAAETVKLVQLTSSKPV